MYDIPLQMEPMISLLVDLADQISRIIIPIIIVVGVVAHSISPCLLDHPCINTHVLVILLLLLVSIYSIQLSF